MNEKIGKAVGVAVVVLFCGATYWFTRPDPGPPTGQVPQAIPEAPQLPSGEMQLATVDLGRPPTNNVEIRPYREMLDALALKYPKDSREAMCRVLIVAQENMQRNGAKESTLELGWNVNRSTPSKLAGIAILPDVTAAYITLRTDGPAPER